MSIRDICGLSHGIIGDAAAFLVGLAIAVAVYAAIAIGVGWCIGVGLRLATH